MHFWVFRVIFTFTYYLLLLRDFTYVFQKDILYKATNLGNIKKKDFCTRFSENKNVKSEYDLIVSGFPKAW